MILDAKRGGALVLRLLAVVVLLGCPGIGSAAGTWSVVSLPQEPGKLPYPTAVSVDAAGNLYVVGLNGNNAKSQIQQRDTQGNWSVIPPEDSDSDVFAVISAIAVDADGNLYVASRFWGSLVWGADRIHQRDAQGNWSVLAQVGPAPGQAGQPSGLAADGAGNLYVADTGNNRVQVYTPTPGP